MSIRIHLPPDILPALAQARVAIASRDFQTARTLSQTISKALHDGVRELAPLFDGPAKEVCLLVVAHRTDPAHRPLLDMLAQLDSARFNVLLIENADGPLFARDQLALMLQIRLLSLGANYGPGVARNLALFLSSDALLVMLDDDGLTDAGAILSLIRTLRTYEAVAVRGRVVPKTPGTDAPPHYDLGDAVVRRLCDVEGLAIWDRAAAAQAGGFDPVMYGHEGRELCSRMFLHHGPDAFLYDPNAVMHHDYDRHDRDAGAKAARHAAHEDYAGFANPHHASIARAFGRQARGPVAREMLEHRARFVALAGSVRPTKPLTATFVTTCLNGADFVQDWYEGLTRQTDQDFKVVLVDDGSTDGSVERARAVSRGDPRVQIVSLRHVGRPAALNHAVSLVQTDLCVICDIDDHPIAQQMAWVKAAFHAYPDRDMIGFMVCDFRNLARSARPFSIVPTDLAVRAVVGMPSPFPAFAWRRDRVTRPFDPGLAACEDMAWMFDTLFKDGKTGLHLPLCLTHYHVHPNQLSTREEGFITPLTVTLLADLHARILGRAVDAAVVAQFARRAEIGSDHDFAAVKNHLFDLYDQIGSFDRVDAQSARTLLRDHLAELTEIHLRHKLQKAAALTDSRAGTGDFKPAGLLRRVRSLGGRVVRGVRSAFRP